MLIEAAYNFPVAYIGGTFDGSVTLFQLTSAETYIGTWSAQVAYIANQAVTASDGNVYVANGATTNNNPVTDGAVHWVLASPYNLTNYKVSMVIENQTNPITLTSLSAGGLTVVGASGSIALSATASQTAVVPAGEPHYYLQLAGSSGQIYFPMSGNINFTTP